MGKSQVRPTVFVLTTSHPRSSLLQSKPTAKAQKKKQKGRKGDASDSAYVNPNEETATPTFDEPARVRILSAPTKVNKVY